MRIKHSILAAASSLLFTTSFASAADITGAGATFPYPLYSKWAEAYAKETGAKMNYQSIGSGGGIKQIKAKTVDFGASDMPLPDEELAKEGLVQFPMIMGGVVPVVNLGGVGAGQMRLSPETLAGIYLGKITKWNDSAVASDNPGMNLPATDIVVVHRADGSGTTFLFTDYLSKTVPAFKSTVGSGTAVKWPAGIGGKGNEGVSAHVQRTPGAIGYVEYAYVKKGKLAHTQLKNRDGAFVQPDDMSFKAAAANADWSKAPVLTDQAGKGAWPITGASFILMHAKAENPDRARAALKFFDWSYRNGGPAAAELDYVAMPESVINSVRASWKTSFKDASDKPILQ